MCGEKGKTAFMCDVCITNMWETLIWSTLFKSECVIGIDYTHHFRIEMEGKQTTIDRFML